MKLLLDQGTPRSAAALLRADGLDAVHTGEVGMATAEDAAILDRGLTEGRLIVTLDADFHRLLALSGATRPSVIRIRIEGLKGDEIAQFVRTVLAACAEELARGAVVSVQPDGMRLRRLPLRA